MKIRVDGYREFRVGPRFVLAIVAAGVIAGCCSRPTSPSAQEVDVACHEVAILAAQAKLNAPWSAAEIAVLDAECAAICSNLRRFAR